MCVGRYLMIGAIALVISAGHLPVAHAEDGAQAGDAPDAGIVLKVVITGFENDDGKVRVALFRSEEGFPSKQDKAYRREAAYIVAGKARVAFTNLPAGTYAVGAFHDEDSDSKLDKNLVGMPTEAWGASNAAKGFMGPPSYEDASFSVDASRVIEIEVE